VFKTVLKNLKSIIIMKKFFIFLNYHLYNKNNNNNLYINSLINKLVNKYISSNKTFSKNFKKFSYKFLILKLLYIKNFF